MNSVPFSRASITNATNHLWYEIDREYILARIPLQTSKQEEWIPSNSPKLYRWVISSIMDSDFAVAEDMQHNNFIPLAAIQTKGKKIRCTNGDIISSEDADWLIWGVDHQNKPKELRVFRSNKIIRLKMKDCLNLPEFILSNEDSGYILVSYDDSLKSSNAEDTLNNICNYLKVNNLLKKYFRHPIVKQTNRTDEHLCSPVLSKRGWFDPLPPEELESRKREFQASQPLKELFPAAELKLPFQVNVSPLHQRTVFQTLTGIHPDVIDDFDFRLIHQLAMGIVQFLADSLLLFPCKGDAAYQGSLFFAFLSQQYR